jgi:hypothetical protein
MVWLSYARPPFDKENSLPKKIPFRKGETSR